MPHPRDPNIVYGSCKGQYGVMNLRVGQEKSYWVGAQSLYGNPASDLILRFQRVSPMATSPHDPDVLYYGSQHVHRTRDKGVTWEKISPDLTAKPECCQGISGEPITRDITGEEFYSTLYAITESPLEKGVIWTGANDGPFHITRNNGKTWTNITPPDLPTGGRVQFIEASPHRKGSAYFAVYRYLLGDYAPYIYRTDDYGKTWTRLTDGKNGIPADWPTRVVREDPDREGLLYAGTEFGMFISFDNGAHWQPFQLNLPNVPDHGHQSSQQGFDCFDARPRVLDSRQHQFAASAFAANCVSGMFILFRAARRLSHSRRAGESRTGHRILLAGKHSRRGYNRVCGCEGRGDEFIQH